MSECERAAAVAFMKTNLHRYVPEISRPLVLMALQSAYNDGTMLRPAPKRDELLEAVREVDQYDLLQCMSKNPDVPPEACACAPCTLKRVAGIEP